MKSVRERMLDRFQLAHVEREVEGEKVWIKMLSDAKLEAYQFSRMDLDTMEVEGSKVEGAQSELVALCLCEEDGKLVFKNQKEAADMLPSLAIRAIYKVCTDVNSMTADIEEAGKD